MPKRRIVILIVSFVLLLFAQSAMIGIDATIANLADETETFIVTVSKPDNAVAFVEFLPDGEYTVMRVNVPKGPTGIAVRPDRQVTYVTSQDANIVSVIDNASHQVIRTIALGAGSKPYSVAFRPDGQVAYVVNAGTKNVNVIDAVQHTVLATIRLPGAEVPQSLTFRLDGIRAYVGDSESGLIQVLDTVNHQHLKSLSTQGLCADGVQVSHLGRWLYVADSCLSNIYAIEVDTIESFIPNIRRIPLSSLKGAWYIAFSPDDRFAYVSQTKPKRNTSNGQIAIIDTEQKRQTGTAIPVGGLPAGLQTILAPAMSTELATSQALLVVFNPASRKIQRVVLDQNTGAGIGFQDAIVTGLLQEQSGVVAAPPDFPLPPVATVTPTITPIASPTATVTGLPTPTPTGAGSPTPTGTPAPAHTPTPTVTSFPTLTPTSTPTCVVPGWRLGAGTEGVTVYSIAPAQGEQKVFAGTWGQGVYVTGMNTNDWAPAEQDGHLGNDRVSALAIYPARPQTLFAGTHGRGIFKSIDSGQHWEQKFPPVPVPSDVNVWTLRVMPESPSGQARIWAGFEDGGTWVSENEGEIWTERRTGLGKTTVYALTGHSQGGTDILYAGTAEQGMWKSNNSGANWQRMGLEGTTIRAVAVHGSTVYVGTEGQGVYRSTDGGRSWYAKNRGLRQSADVFAIQISPVNPRIVYAGVWGDGVYVSPDSGDTWFPLYELSGNARLVYSLAVVRQEGTNCQALYAGTVNGVWRTGIQDQWPDRIRHIFLPLILRR